MGKYRQVWHPFCCKEEPVDVGREVFLSLATVSSGAILSSLGASKCVMADRCCRITFTICRLFWQSYGTMTATFIIVLHSGMHSWDQLGIFLYGRSVYRFWQNNQNIPKRIFIKRMPYGSLFLIRVSQFRLKIFVPPSPPLPTPEYWIITRIRHSMLLTPGVMVNLLARVFGVVVSRF